MAEHRYSIHRVPYPGRASAGLRRPAAAQAHAYNGVLTVAFTGTPGGAADAGCSNGVAWPEVDDIEVLGLGAVNVSSVMVTVGPLGILLPFPSLCVWVRRGGKLGTGAANVSSAITTVSPCYDLVHGMLPLSIHCCA